MCIRYDLYDDVQYVAWLQQNHPESLPCPNSDIIFSQEEQELFSTRYENGYVGTIFYNDGVL